MVASKRLCACVCACICGSVLVAVEEAHDQGSFISTYLIGRPDAALSRALPRYLFPQYYLASQKHSSKVARHLTSLPSHGRVSIILFIVLETRINLGSDDSELQKKF